MNAHLYLTVVRDSAKRDLRIGENTLQFGHMPDYTKPDISTADTRKDSNVSNRHAQSSPTNGHAALPQIFPSRELSP
jgi:hypothetical protein